MDDGHHAVGDTTFGDAYTNSLSAALRAVHPAEDRMFAEPGESVSMSVCYGYLIVSPSQTLPIVRSTLPAASTISQRS